MKKNMKPKKELKEQELNLFFQEIAKGKKEEILKKYSSSENGLMEKEAEKRREKFGLNIIENKEKNPLLKKIYDAFINPFSLVLILLGLISLSTDYIFVAESERSLKTVIVIGIMVVLSGGLRFIQEGRSNKAGEKLKAMVKTTTLVLRDGKSREIPISEVVIGDIIKIAAGDMIPADIRVLQGKDLFISQSAMTGESEPIEKFDREYLANFKEKKSIFSFENIVYLGTNVISGTGTGVVVAIGNETYLGMMSDSITKRRETTSFDKGINSVSWLLIKFMFFMVPIVFFVNGLSKGDWLEALLFAISIAVGLTPEMLPMIVTTNLAKGAIIMSKNKTIVKNLNSIQNFGAMDILCTDKTGTLTEDKIILERHLNIHGEEDLRVLRHGYLNSYFQTGLKNLLDLAIISHGDLVGMEDLREKYDKIDEIPFDFQRKRMSVVLKNIENKSQLITKGAIEEMLSISKYVEYKGDILALSKEIENEILATVYKLNNEGMRVIGVAQRNFNLSLEAFSVKDESEMVLMGYIGFLDPPKESSVDAIKALKDYGVEVKVLTGDNEIVSKHICKKVGIDVTHILLGSEIEEIDDEKLKELVEITNLFAKLNPQQKSRIVSLLKENGHVVGFMGDGINDAPAMRKADVGISVDSAVDIAKESADIILLEKDLLVLERGVIQGRKTFANIIKYIKMTASSNFGNMFSILVASAFLPFLPMLPIHILILNLIYDVSCMSIPWDNVDEEYLKIPRKWKADSIGKFMLWIGPTSSIFDITTYGLMFFIICPLVFGGSFNTLGNNQKEFMALFNTGWFVESLWTQMLVIHMLRTDKTPFINSLASKWVLLSTGVTLVLGTGLSYTNFGQIIGFIPLPKIYYIYLILTVVLYIVLVSIIKKIYMKRFKSFL